MNYKKLIIINLNLILIATVSHLTQVLDLLSYWPESYYNVIIYGSHYFKKIDYAFIICVLLVIINLTYLLKKE